MPITISKRNLQLTAAAIVGLLAGLIIGWAAFAHPALAPSSVPTAAVEVAQEAGNEILVGTAPTELNPEIFTDEFLTRYPTEYNAYISTMATSDISWSGTPVVTWTGSTYIDVCLTANTQAGVIAVELRMTRSGSAWKVAQILSLQLREAK